MTKLEEFIAQLHEISSGVAELRERMARLEEKVDSLKAHARDGKETDRDHEARIRSLEKSKAAAVGWATGIGTVFGWVFSTIWRKLFG